MRLVALLSLALAGCAHKLPPAPAAHPVSLQWRDTVDWDAAGDEAVEMLQHYLRIDTINPPGNETAGARYLAALLERDDIASEIVEFAPGRGSLIARLKGDGSEPGAVCMLSHIDVVPAEDEYWPADAGPLSGAIKDGHLWGRGALDMKGMGVLELHTMAMLKRLNVPLKRDVVLVAVSDEEVFNKGMIDLVDNHWDKLGCTWIINEGAFGVSDALVEGQTVHAVSVGERGFLWVQVVASGEPGHGSTPRPGTAPPRLRAAMDAIDKHMNYKVNWHPMMLELLAAVGADTGGISGFVMQRPGLVKLLAKGTLTDNPVINASLTTTVHLTGVSGATDNINVLPSELRANYDVRVQPDTTPEAVLAAMEEAIEGIEGVRIEVIDKHPAAVSEWHDDPFYDAINAHAMHDRKSSVSGPFLSIGYTDSIFARRAKNVRAYGYVPMVINTDLLVGMHGHNERAPVSEIKEGTKRMFGTIVQAAAHLDRPVVTPTGPTVKPVPSELDLNQPSAPEQPSEHAEPTRPSAP